MATSTVMFILNKRLEDALVKGDQPRTGQQLQQRQRDDQGDKQARDPAATSLKRS